MADNTTVPATRISETVNVFCHQTIWYIFLGASGGSYLFGLLLILNYKLFRRLNQSELEQTGKQPLKGSMMSKIYRTCESLAAGQSFMGKVLILSSFLLSMASVVIYIYLTFKFGEQRKPYLCPRWQDYRIMLADFAFNMFFLIHFFIRLTASQQLLLFWLRPDTIVDFFTVVPQFIMCSYNSYPTGFRFLRALRLMDLPDVLVYLHIISSRSSIRISKLLCPIVAVWFAGAGAIHMLENAGDFWAAESNAQQWNYYTSLYFLLVTMSTVGYGDYSPKSYLGRVFVMIYITCALGMFASFVPEIAEILADKKLYSGDYEIQYGRRHVVVCGHLTLRGIKAFLRDILHPDRDEKEKNIRVIFLGQDEPDLKLAALMKRHETKVQYFQGNVTNNKDLDRVKIKAAEAVMILANTQASDAHEEDWSSIMRVIAIKDYVPTCKIIVQIIQYQNKAYLSNIPSWNQIVSFDSGETCGDQALCMSELKLGLMAQSCLAPGFSTFLVNLLTLVKTNLSSIPKHSWQHAYARGASYELYKVRFAPAFQGMTFSQAVEICMNKLNIMLIAVEVQLPNNEKRMLINPWDNVRISCHSMDGLVLANNESESHRMEIFCTTCHSDVRDATKIKHCRCDIVLMSIANATFHLGDHALPCDCKRPSCRVSMDASHVRGVPLTPRPYQNKAYTLDNGDIDNQSPEKTMRLLQDRVSLNSSEVSVLLSSENADENINVDSTGLFHWCPQRSVKEVELTYRVAVNKKFKDHVVVCLISQRKSASIGLCNFVMPLRSSSIERDQLKDIVIVGDPNFISKEWTTLQNLPRIHILPGSPLNRAFLRAVNIKHCSSCVILSAQDATPVDPTLMDKEPILCALNIKTMPRCRDGSSSIQSDVLGDNVPLLTEIRHESNVQFLDQDDDNACEEMFMTQPFATGRMFNISVLDSLISTIFFNPSALTCLETLVTGGATSEVEQILAEGLGLLPGRSVDPACRYRCCACLLAVNKPPLNDCVTDVETLTFSELFNAALQEHGIICLGLSRLIDPTSTARHARRFVYTFPQKRTRLLKTDLAFCLRPMRPGLLHQNSDPRLDTRL